MSRAKLRVVSPELLAGELHSGKVKQAVTDLARLADLELAVEGPDCRDDAANERAGGSAHTPIRHRDRTVGKLILESPPDHPAATQAAGALTSLFEHMVAREAAVTDLADALMTGYEELNLLYTLLPAMATKVDPAEIGQVLVDEAAKTLGCRRVSLLVLDEKRKAYRVLGSCGLPPEALDVDIPVSGSVAAEALAGDDVFVVDHMSQRPDLAGRSRGQYEGDGFAVVRVPLKAHGEALGFLTATERIDDAEFTAHDHKLLEGLSAMGASALLNCRLHTTVNKQMISTIHALASAVDAKDHYTHDHAGRVARLCVATARQLGVTDAKTCREVELAGLLHDIGKIGIPDAILSKPADLTPEEFRQIQAHVKVGARIVSHVPGLERVAEATLHHHERYDGLGYPSGLSGEDIPLAAALIAVTDAFDALTSDRPYRQAGSVEDALQELRRCRGAQFNPCVVDAFVAVVQGGMGKGTDGRDEDLIALQPALAVQ